MKCGYNNCKHGGEVSKEDSIKIGTRYFHKECANEKENKKSIEEYWLIEINPGTVIQILRKAINDLVKIYDSDYVLWLVKTSKSKGIKLNYPMGLKKIADDKKFKDEWNKIKNNRIARQIKDDVEYNVVLENNKFEYKRNVKNFSNII